MVREMKRALGALKNGDSQGYRKIFDAAYDEVYCRSLLIIQKEEAALGFVKSFFGELFGKLDEADLAESQEKWFWQKYYEYMRKQYSKLLSEQEKTAQPSGRVRTLAEIPSSLPLLHRIMLVMHEKDDFTASEISGVFRLEEGKVQEELNKLEKILPALVKGQPEGVSGYLGNWKLLLLGASKQILSTGSDEGVDELYAEAAANAGIASVPSQEKKDDFEYFVADVELSDIKDRKSKAAVTVEEPEDEEEEEPEYDDDEDADDGEDEYEDEEDEEDEDDDDDGRYDWDLEDDGKKMVILGIVLALIIVAVIGIVAFKLLGKGDGESNVPTQTENSVEEENDAELIIRGDGPEEESENSGESEEAEEEEEAPEEEVQEEEPAESETLKMKVSASSVNVRSEPNTNCDVLTTVKNGEQVEILGDPSEEWVQIRCIEQNSQEGYVKSEFLTAIE